MKSKRGIDNRWELLERVLDIPKIKNKFDGYGVYRDENFHINKNEHWCGWWNDCFCFVDIWAESDYGREKLKEIENVFAEYGYTFNRSLVNGGLGIKYETMTAEESDKKAESNLLHGGRMSD